MTVCSCIFFRFVVQYKLYNCNSKERENERTLYHKNSRACRVYLPVVDSLFFVRPQPQRIRRKDYASGLRDEGKSEK